jgi:cell division protein FtsL
MDKIEKALVVSMAACAMLMLGNFVYEGIKVFL